MWEFYDALIDGVTSVEPIEEVISGKVWTFVRTNSNCGIAMTTRAESRPLLYKNGYRGLPLKEAAKLVKSWNFIEASVGMAAINTFYNTHALMMKYNALQPGHQYCTAGMDLKGKRVGMVGHLRASGNPFAGAKDVLILERRLQDGDYPDSACEYLLADCDVVIITGSAITNKTMPRLLQICKNSAVVITGPSVPMAQALLRFGASRIAGLIINDVYSMKTFAASEIHGPPYQYGERYCIDNKLLKGD